MQLHVFDWVTERVAEQVELDDRPLSLGSEAGNRIVLPSQLVAAHHAEVYGREGIWYIKALTAFGPVTVNEEEIPRAKPVRIRPGDDIKLGQYSLYLVEPDARDLAPGGVDPNSPSAKALAFEESLHDRLLAALQLQTVGSGERRSPEFMTRIDRALLEMIRTRLGELDEPTGNHFIAAYLKRRLAAEIAEAAERRSARGSMPSVIRDVFDANFRSPAGDQIEPSLAAAVRGIAGRLGLHLSRLRPGQRLTRDKVLDDMHAVDERFADALPDALAVLPPTARGHMIVYMVGKDIHDILFGYGPLEDLLRMPDVEEIMVLNEDQIYVGKEGRVESTGRRFFSRKVVLSIIERIVGEVGRKIDFREPLVDARLPDGSRVNAVIPPVAVSGPTLTIRRFPESRFTMDDLVALGTLTEPAGNFLAACVKAKKNVLVSGGTGTGKTTLLNVLAGYIGRDERVVTIEDAAELNLPQKHVVTLEARPAGLEGTGAVTIDMLLRNALRMRPDRILVGECRGAEAVEMLQAMNTGHDGSLTTVHANDVTEALQRIETMVLKAGLDLPSRAIREQIVSALDVVVQITRRPDGRRAVTRISEVAMLDERTGQIIVQDVFAWRDDGADEAGRPLGRAAHTGYIPSFAEPMIARGLVTVEDLLGA